MKSVQSDIDDIQNRIQMRSVYNARRAIPHSPLTADIGVDVAETRLHRLVGGWYQRTVSRESALSREAKGYRRARRLEVRADSVHLCSQ